MTDVLLMCWGAFGKVSVNALAMLSENDTKTLIVELDEFSIGMIKYYCSNIPHHPHTGIIHYSDDEGNEKVAYQRLIGATQRTRDMVMRMLPIVEQEWVFFFFLFFVLGLVFYENRKEKGRNGEDNKDNKMNRKWKRKKEMEK